MRVGIDAHILLRALLDDHPRQSTLAKRLLTNLGPEQEGYVGVSALLEVFGTLRSRYAIPREALCDVMNGVLSTQDLTVESSGAVARAILRFRKEHCDFQDALLAERNLEADCNHTYTFDIDASRRVPSMDLLA
jgi:predicted nucleic-acid-binding protein